MFNCSCVLKVKYINIHKKHEKVQIFIHKNYQHNIHHHKHHHNNNKASFAFTTRVNFVTTTV